MYHSEILTFYANIPYVQSILCLVVKIATPNPISLYVLEHRLDHQRKYKSIQRACKIFTIHALSRIQRNPSGSIF